MSKVKVSDDRTDLKPKSEEVSPKKVRVQSKPPGDSDDGSSDDSGPESDQGEDSDKPKSKRQLKRELKELKAYLR
ncbi:hypothetical protein H0H93_006199, partial [Arthromyces matolae]